MVVTTDTAAANVANESPTSKTAAEVPRSLDVVPSEVGFKDGVEMGAQGSTSSLVEAAAVPAGIFRSQVADVVSGDN